MNTIPNKGYASAYPLPENCMFMTPYFQYHIEEWSDRKEEILSDLYSYHDSVINKEPEDLGDTCHTSYYEKSEYEEFRPFMEILGPYLQRFSSEILHKKFYRKPIDDINRIWFQVQEQYEFHALHNHGPEGWSAVFYADFNPKVHETTRFCSTYFTCDGELLTFQPGCKEGDIIIFPSQINHESVINRSSQSRTIISLNMK